MAKKEELRAQSMLNEPIGKLVLKMAIPTIIAQLITIIYNLTDTFFVSQLGTNATAAVGVNSSIEQVINMMGIMIGAGASSYIARLLGAGNRKRAERVFSTSVFVGIGFGVLLTIIGLSFIDGIVKILGADSNCEMYSVQYGTYVFMAAPFMVASLILNQCLKSEGSATLAMVGIGFGGILNCVLDPIFIFTLDLGVAGASIATAISKVVSCAILLYPYVMKKSVINFSIKNFKLDLQDTKEIVTIGSSNLFRNCFSILANTLMNRAASAYSTAILAAISVSNRVMMFPFCIILGFGMGYTPVAGFNWGAKRYDRAEESFTFAQKVSIVGSTVMAVLFFIFSRQIIGIFNSEADAEVLRVGMLCIKLQSIALPMHAYTSIVNMFYAGVGKPKQALILSVARQGYCFLPLMFIIPAIFDGTGLAAVQAGADLISIAVGLPMGIAAMKMVREKKREVALEG